MIAAQQQQPDLGLAALDFGCQHDGFDRALQRDTQLLGHGLALGAAGRMRLGERFGGSGTRCGRGDGFSSLDVRGVVRIRAVDDGVFARVGNHVEFVRARSANRAVIGRHGAEFQAEALEDARVGVVHLLIRHLQAFGVAVEGVCVLHREFAAAHDAETRTALVTELGLDLVEIDGQLLVRANFSAGDVGHHLLRRRLHDEVALVAILEAQQLVAHLVPAAGLLPQLARLHHRHQHLHRAGGVHFLTHDLLDLADHAQTHGHVRIEARAKLLDHAGTHHQLVRDDLRVSGRFLERGNEELGRFHATDNKG